MERFKDIVMDLLSVMGWSVIIGIILFSLFMVVLVVLYVIKGNKEYEEDKEAILYDTYPYDEPEDRW